MVNLLDLVQVYDDALEPDICDILISGFQEVSSLHEHINTERDHYKNLNLTENLDSWMPFKDTHNLLIRKTFEYRDKYYEHVDKRVFPVEHQFEHYHIRKYSIDDYSNTRVDVDNYDDARRFLCFMWYLDSNEFGSTEFTDLTIIPRKGKLIIFPPLWTFPYKIHKIVEGENHILTTYLHYK